ncbi:MAG: hypothetical protein Nk1A_7220 [Endomicrobiia bacterium]|nr:MAG: hypothetical protein Nk1A_7220 [Endomicrobiia bacterium]
MFSMFSYILLAANGFFVGTFLGNVLSTHVFFPSQCYKMFAGF